MQEIIKTLAIAWIGACVRNKDDRDRTLKFVNGLGNTLEKTVKEFMPSRGGGASVPTDEPASTEEEFQ